MRPREEQLLVCYRREFRLELWSMVEEPVLMRAYPIAVGMQGYRTDAGVYRINARSNAPEWRMPDSPWVSPEDRGKVIPAGVPENPIKERFIGFGSTGEGIHGTADLRSLGTAASHGCLRMSPEDVIDIYPEVPMGTILVVF